MSDLSATIFTKNIESKLLSELKIDCLCCILYPKLNVLYLTSYYFVFTSQNHKSTFQRLKTHVFASVLSCHSLTLSNLMEKNFEGGGCPPQIFALDIRGTRETLPHRLLISERAG